MTPFRKTAAVKLARYTVDRRADQLTIVPKQLLVSRREKMCHPGQGLSERTRRFVRKAANMRMTIFEHTDPSGDTILSFVPTATRGDVITDFWTDEDCTPRRLGNSD